MKSKPTRRKRHQALRFDKPFRHVVGLDSSEKRDKGKKGAFGFDRLPPAERAVVLKSQAEAHRRLALKTSGYNRSRAQTADSEGAFTKWHFAFRAWKYLPAIRREILAAVEQNDLDYFEKLGKTIAALKKQPAAEEADPLGYFLTNHWVIQRSYSRVPSFCLLSPNVLTEVCNSPGR